MDEMDLEKNPSKHYRDIGMAVEFARRTVKTFVEIPERVVPSFAITEDEINYLEERVRETVRKNHKAANVDMGEGYEAFFEDVVRIGLNMMLNDENHPTMGYYLKDYKEGAK